MLEVMDRMIWLPFDLRALEVYDRGTSGKEVKAGTEMGDESLFHCAPLAGV